MSQPMSARMTGKAELHHLKTVDRPAVINAISEARAQGDLSENAEYEAAKDRQGFIEGRILEVEGKLSAAQVIDPAGLDIYWGAYLGTPEQLLVSGPLGDVAEEIIRVRADAAARLGWVFDTYLLRRRDREPARGG